MSLIPRLMHKIHIFLKFLYIVTKTFFFLLFGPYFCLVFAFQSSVQYNLLHDIHNTAETSFLAINRVDNLKLCISPDALQILAELIKPKVKYYILSPTDLGEMGQT